MDRKCALLWPSGLAGTEQLPSEKRSARLGEKRLAVIQAGSDRSRETVVCSCRPRYFNFISALQMRTRPLFRLSDQTLIFGSFIFCPLQWAGACLTYPLWPSARLFRWNCVVYERKNATSDLKERQYSKTKLD